MSLATMDRAGVEEAPRAVRLADVCTRAIAAQRGRSVLWAAPALSAGIGIYFALPEEPGAMLLILPGLAGAVLIWLGRASGPVLLAGLVLWGFALAGLQSRQAATPLLAAATGEVTVTG